MYYDKTFISKNALVLIYLEVLVMLIKHAFLFCLLSWAVFYCTNKATGVD